MKRVILLALAIAMPAAASAAPPPGWAPHVPQSGTARSYDAQTVPGTSMFVSSPLMLDQTLVVRRLRAMLAFVPSLCIGEPQPPESASGHLILRTLGTDHRCVIAAEPAGVGTYVIALGIAAGPRSMDSDALTVATVAFARDAASVLPPAAPPIPQSGSPGPMSTAPLDADHVPVGALSMSYYNVMAHGLSFESWFLFCDGIATNCTRLDPGLIPHSLPVLRARRDCSGARWRRVGDTIELQQTDSGAWSSQNVAAKAPAPKDLRLDFVGETLGGAQGGSDTGSGAVHVVNGGAFTLTKAGQIDCSSWSDASFANTTAGTTVTASSGSHRRGLHGRYTIDGFLLTVVQDDGSVVRRMIYIDRGKSARYQYVNFENTLYWLPGKA